ncbi:bZIP transcription factor 16-like protein [Tanacetum coccineum]
MEVKRKEDDRLYMCYFTNGNNYCRFDVGLHDAMMSLGVGKLKDEVVCTLPNAGRVDSGNGIRYMNIFDAQDERELKRQKRKQSNRESAHRSRLRKQVATRRKSLDEYLKIMEAYMDIILQYKISRSANLKLLVDT